MPTLFPSTADRRKTPAAGYVQLLARGEPYRLLFPLGAALGIAGVMLWPGHVWFGMAYPLQAHAGIMIQGFLTAFVIGFLGTALPRLLDVEKLGLVHALGYAILLLAITVLYLGGRPLAAHLVFLILLISFGLSLGRRARLRKDIPPPGFVLVLMGFACAVTGTGLLIADALSPDGLGDSLYRLARLLLQQGFLLLPIMGIGAFLLPRFFGLPNRQSFPESLAPPPGWMLKALFACSCGTAVIVSFVLEAVGWWQGAFFLRAGALTLYFFREVPLHRAAFGHGSLAWALRMALLSLPLGYLSMGIFPAWQLSLVHIVFITGFSLLTFTVATRVILGHSGQEALFTHWLKPVIGFTLLFLLAMVTRVSADWMPSVRFTHYAYASLTWALAVLVWMIWILPGVRRGDTAD